jgi:hypothetical protein
VRNTKSRSGVQLSLVTALVSVAFLVFLFPIIPHPGPMVNTTDFSLFRAAAWDLLHGLNPYHLADLRSGLLASGIHVAHPSPYAAYVMPLIVAVLLLWSPFVSLGAGVAIVVGTARLFIASATYAISRWLGVPRPGFAAALVTISPVATSGYVAAQVDAFVLLLLIGGIFLIYYRRFIEAGLLLGVAVWVKPEVAWVIAPFAIVLVWHERYALKRLLVGMAIASVVSLFLPMLWLPAWTLDWIHRLRSFGASVATVQPDSGLSSIFRLFPHSWGMAPSFSNPFVWLLIVGGLVSMILWGRHLLAMEPITRERICLGLGVPLALWALCSPYVHVEDTLLLLPLLIVLMRPNWLGGKTLGWALCLALIILPEVPTLAGDIGLNLPGNWQVTSLGVLWLLVLALIKMGDHLALSTDYVGFDPDRLQAFKSPWLRRWVN